MRVFKLIWTLFKKIFLKFNITVLKGDVRKKVLDMGADQIPEDLLKNSKVVSSRYQVLKYLPKGGTAVEVGVAYGEFSDKILAELRPSKFIAIDAFGSLPIISNKGKNGLEEEAQSQHFTFYKNKFNDKILDGSLVMMRGYSWEMLAKLENSSVDYIYIDADHSYESVVKDIQASKNKLKPGGIIQFNDYTCFEAATLEPYGVYKAVNEFLIRENFEIIYLCLHKYGSNDLVVKSKS